MGERGQFGNLVRPAAGEEIGAGSGEQCLSGQEMAMCLGGGALPGMERSVRISSAAIFSHPLPTYLARQLLLDLVLQSWLETSRSDFTAENLYSHSFYRSRLRNHLAEGAKFHQYSIAAVLSPSASTRKLRSTHACAMSLG